MAEIPNILEVYNYAPWLFDGAVICLVLGLLFRMLFTKSKIGKDDGQSAKLGGITGFVIGLIIVIGMQTKGLLLIDLWSWLVIGILAIGALLLWKWLIDLFGNEHKWMVTLFVIIMTALIAGTLLGSMPEFTTVTFGNWGEGLMKWVVWLAIIFLVVWGISRMPKLFGRGGGGGEGGGRGGDGEGGGGRGGGGGWWPRWPFGGKKKPKTPEEAKKDVDGATGDAEKKEDDAKKAADNASAAAIVARAAVEKLKKAKDTLRDYLASIKDSVGKMNAKKLRACEATIANHFALWQKAYEEFKRQKIIDEFEICHREYDQLGKSLKMLLGQITEYSNELKAIGSEIAKIEDTTIKAQLAEEYRVCESELSAIQAELTTALKKFDEDVKEALKDANLAMLAKSLEDIDKDSITFRDEVTALALRHFEALAAELDNKGPNADALRYDLETGLTTILNICQALNEKIDTFLNSYLSYLETAVQALKNALNLSKKVLEDIERRFYEVHSKTEELGNKADAQYTKEKSERAAREGELTEVNDIILLVDAERKKLGDLIQHTRQFINMLITLFKLKEGAIAELETKVHEATEEGMPIETVFRGVSGAKVNAKFLPDPDAAQGMTKEKIDIVKGWLKAEFRDVAQNKKTVNDAITALTKAANDLQTRLNSGTGIPIGHEPKLRELLTNLQRFLAEEAKVKNALENYEDFVLNVVDAQVRAALTNKSFKLTVIPTLQKALGILRELENLIKNLGAEEYVIREEAIEEAIPPSGGRRTAPTEPIPPAPPSGP